MAQDVSEIADRLQTGVTVWYSDLSEGDEWEFAGSLVRAERSETLGGGVRLFIIEHDLELHSFERVADYERVAVDLNQPHAVGLGSLRPLSDVVRDMGWSWDPDVLEPDQQAVVTAIPLLVPQRRLTGEAPSLEIVNFTGSCTLCSHRAHVGSRCGRCPAGTALCNP